MNDFVDYCIGVCLLLIGISFFMISIALVTGIIK
jgi:hypothetical protein